MTTRIRITPDSWSRLQLALLKEYKRSEVIISWKRLEVLGFDLNSDILDNVILTFENDRQAVLFQLKYSEYIDQGRKPYGIKAYNSTRPAVTI